MTELATLIGDVEAGTSFVARRDAAILRFLASTGCRLEEVAELQITHLDIGHLTALVKGKGGKARLVRFDRRCAAALKRYLPMRAGHRHAASGHVWLGVCNRPPLQANGIYQMVVRRASRLGIYAYPHKFRHTFAHNWLDNGGHEGDLMVLNGWTSEAMLHYYGSSVSGERARRHCDQIDVMRGV